MRALYDSGLWSNRLLGKREDFPEIAVANGRAQCECAATFRWDHVQYRNGEFVFVDEGAPCVIELACCLDASEFLLLVTPCANVTRRTC